MGARLVRAHAMSDSLYEDVGPFLPTTRDRAYLVIHNYPYEHVVGLTWCEYMGKIVCRVTRNVKLVPQAYGRSKRHRVKTRQMHVDAQRLCWERQDCQNHQLGCPDDRHAFHRPVIIVCRKNFPVPCGEIEKKIRRSNETFLLSSLYSIEHGSTEEVQITRVHEAPVRGSDRLFMRGVQSIHLHVCAEHRTMWPRGLHRHKTKRFDACAASGQRSPCRRGGYHMWRVRTGVVKVHREPRQSRHLRSDAVWNIDFFPDGPCGIWRHLPPRHMESYVVGRVVGRGVHNTMLRRIEGVAHPFPLVS